MSAETKYNCKAHADSKKIKICQVWSGPDFEEHLRFHAPSVLNRFFNGEELPEDEAELRKFMLELDPATEKEAGLLVARLFNRPAFQTPSHCESSMPAFSQAIADTIGALIPAFGATARGRSFRACRQATPSRTRVSRRGSRVARRSSTRCA